MSYVNDTIRSLMGKGPAGVAGTVVNTDDPLQIGRVQIAPDFFDQSKVKEEDLPWCFIQEAVPGQSWTGSTRHSHLFSGMRVQTRFDPDGTGHIVTSHHSQTGNEPPPGSSQPIQGDTTYPGNCTEQG